mgnify:FL=1
MEDRYIDVGLRSLRDSYILLFISLIILMATYIIVLGSLVPKLLYGVGNVNSIIDAVRHWLNSPAALSVGILSILAMLLSIASLALQLRGFVNLAKVNRGRYGFGILGIVLILFGLAIASISLAEFYLTTGSLYIRYQAVSFTPLLQAPVALTYLFILALGLLLMAVGIVLVSIALWRLGHDYDEGLVTVAALLLAFSVFVWVLSIAASILLAIGLNSIMKAIKAQ